MMNKEQQRYLQTRIITIYSTKVQALSRKYQNNRNGFLSIAEKIERIKAGEYTFIGGANEDSRNGYLEYSIKYNQPKSQANIEYQEALKKLTSEKERLMDELMLGDVKEALKMLEAFRKWDTGAEEEEVYDVYDGYSY